MSIFLIVASITIVALPIIAIGAIIYWFVRVETRRRQKLEEIGSRLNLRYSEKGSPELLDTNKNFGLIQYGYGEFDKRACHVLEGILGETKIVVFDYRFSKRTRKSRAHYAQTVAIVTPGDAEGLPDFKLRKENIGDKLIGAVMTTRDSDIDFEDSIFSQKYHLLCDSESISQVEKIFTPSVRNALCSQENLWIECVGGKVLLCKRNFRRVGPESLENFIKSMLGYYKMLQAGLES